MTESITPSRSRRTRAARVLGIGTVSIVLVSCGSDGGGTSSVSSSATASANASPTSGTHLATAPLVDPSGADKGTVKFTEEDGRTRVVARVTGLAPGFHGLHVHSIGTCEPDSVAPGKPDERGDFLSAGGHLKGDGPEGAAHPHHSGDLPPILVTADGSGDLSAVTDRLTRANLLDADGSTVMIHEKSDNLANIPDRYRPGGADDETKNAGDGGKRIACGVVQR